MPQPLLNSSDTARLTDCLARIEQEDDASLRWEALDQLRYFCDGADIPLLEVIGGKKFSTLAVLVQLLQLAEELGGPAALRDAPPARCALTLAYERLPDGLCKTSGGEWLVREREVAVGGGGAEKRQDPLVSALLAVRAPTEPLVWIISPKPSELCSAACHAPSLFTAAVDSKEGFFVLRDQGLHKLILLGGPDARWHAAGLVAPLHAPLQRERPV